MVLRSKAAAHLICHPVEQTVNGKKRSNLTIPIVREFEPLFLIRRVAPGYTYLSPA